MKPRYPILLLIVVLLLPALAFAQKNVYGGTGNVRFKLNRAGSFSLYDKDFVTQVDRASILVALDSAHVFDYQEDANYLISSTILSVVGQADTVATTLYDNSWTTPTVPPDVRVLQDVYAWKGDSLVLTNFVITNYSAASYNLHIGLGCVPSPSETYGGETVAYDSVAKMAYFYREGEAPYVGIKVLGQNPASFHVLDWDTYSPSDPTSDAATDSTRWSMTALPGFDHSLVAGVDGSFFNLNFGSQTIASNNSVSYMVAFLYSTSLAGLRAISDSADVRYTAYLAASSIKNAYGGTGAVSFKLNRAGSVEMYSADGTVQLSRASMLVGLDSTHVFDYEEDANYMMTAPALSTGGTADTVAVALFDNSWTNPPPPPDVRVLAVLHAWKNDPFVLVDYTLTNTSPSSAHLAVGMGCVPEPSETYGGETVAYDATKKMAYFHRVGEDPYVGVKVMAQDPSSFHALDWDTYSPTDANNDAATDSTRWRMTALPGFDAPLVAGVDGSFFNLNFGTTDLDPGSSVTYTVAYLYSTSLAGLQTVSDAAIVRFNGPTAVKLPTSGLPERFALEQNYPNPFNPTTVISGQWTADSRVRLVVYDLLGREVAVLADSRYPAGKYSFTFDARNLSSGVYFYRLSAGSFTAVRKMSLIK